MARVMAGPDPARRFLRLAVACAMACGIVVVGSRARACSCGLDEVGPAIAGSDGAFVGTFVAREKLDDQMVAITFAVERVVKGEFGPTAVVRTNAHGASCRIEFLGGPRTGLLLDRASDGVWESSLCQQVSPGQLLAFAQGAFLAGPNRRSDRSDREGPMVGRCRDRCPHGRRDPSPRVAHSPPAGVALGLRFA